MERATTPDRDPSGSPQLNRRRMLGLGAGALGAALVGPGLLSACGSSSNSTTAGTTTQASGAGAGSGDELASLMTAARKERALTTCAIGTPHSYYVPVVDAFEKYAGFDVTMKNPTYLPSLEVSDLDKAHKAGTKAPYDVVEMGVDTSVEAAGKGLLEPYLSTRWSDIPSLYKNADGAWSASYFGVVSFITNIGVTHGFAPKSWDELASSPKTPKKAFAMLGDPRSGQPLAGGLGLLTILSASLANSGSLDDVEPGIDLLASLVDKGIFDPSAATAYLALPDTAGTPSTPINALYSFDEPLAQYNGRANFTKIEANPPDDGLIVGFYPQSIAKNASHPESAKLWIEFLQSDKGAETFLRNGAIPTRFAALQRTGSKVVKDLLPSEKVMGAPVPTQDQLANAQKTIDKIWASKIPTK